MLLASQCSGCTSPLLSPSLSLLDYQVGRSAFSQDSAVALQNSPDKQLFGSLRERNGHGSWHDIQTYLSSLRKCCESRSFLDGESLHRSIVRNGFSQNRFLANSLIQMYGKCGAFTQALSVFTDLLEKNVFSWTIMLSACVECGKIEDALEIFDQMPERDIVGWNIIILACAQHGMAYQAKNYYYSLLQEGTPDKLTFLHVVPLCDNLEQLKQIHGQIAKTGLDCDTGIANSLLNMYSKYDNLNKAEQIFKKVPQRDLYTWNTMISAYVQHGRAKDAFDLFIPLQKEGIIPDSITYIGLIDACGACMDPCIGMDIHKHVVGEGLESDLILGTALTSMYGECNKLDAAKRSFSMISQRDSVSWNAMMDAYAQQGDYSGALQLFTCMQLEGFIPNTVTFVTLLSSCTSPGGLNAGRHVHKCIQLFGFEVDVTLGNSLLSMYGRCGNLDEAFMVFSQMVQQDVVSWNAMINACRQCGEEKIAIDLFQEMINEGIVPDCITLLGVIDACASQAILSEAKHIHSYIERFGLFMNAMIRSALIKMYSKCGSLEDAQWVFDETPIKDTILWNTVISSFAQHGHGERALWFFEQMKKAHGVKPDESTLSIVLSACSHGGLASRGGQYFLEFSQNYGIMPIMDHFNFLIDLFGRSGQIWDVKNLIEQMPVEPNTTSWMALLTSCRKHLESHTGKAPDLHHYEYLYKTGVSIDKKLRF